MRTPATIAGHPIHPMLVPIAIGGFVLSFVFDVVRLASGTAEPWASAAYVTMIGGVVGALCAAIPGFIDLLSLPGGTTRKVGLTHMTLNLTVVVLFIVNAWMRHVEPAVTGTPILLSAVSLVLLVVSGWLGGKMVFEAGVGVGAAGSAESPNPSRPAASRHINA